MEYELFYQLMSDFVERLNALMTERDIYVKKLSKELVISSPALYQYLVKKHLPRLPTLLKIADYFQCTMDFLLGLRAQNNSKGFRKCPPFSERFPHLMQCFGQSKYSISKRLKISPSLIHYWQTGERIPTGEHLVLLAREFHFSIDFSLGREI